MVLLYAYLFEATSLYNYVTISISTRSSTPTTREFLFSVIRHEYIVVAKQFLSNSFQTQRSTIPCGFTFLYGQGKDVKKSGLRLLRA